MFSSAVSSHVTIFILGFMKHERALSSVVLPLPVAPATIMFALFSRSSQKYAASSVFITLLWISSVMLKGFSLNFLIVNVDPLGDTSSLNVAASLCLPYIIASSIGNAEEMCLPALCASWIMKSSKTFLSVNIMFVGKLSKSLCQT